MPPRSILIVDDDPDQVATLALLLSEAGHRVETATSPLYALTLVTQFNPEVVFLDIRMPQMDGYEVLARLKKSFVRARFYAITGQSDDETRRRSSEAGFHGHFVKPLDFADIEKAVQGV